MVVQFTVSVALIIGTLVVYSQIQYAKNRPVGYGRDGLISIATPTADMHDHFDAIRDDLKKSGAIVEMTESHSPLTDLFLALAGFDWRGKDPNQNVSLGTIRVSPEFGKTVGWTLADGRDFSRAFTTDSSAMILNEAAVKLMGFTGGVGEIVKLEGVPFTVIGVVKDVLMESPYTPVRPSVYMLNQRKGNFAVMKLNPALGAQASLRKIESTLKTYNPATPFDYQFAEQDYAKKFAAEERIGNLASVFAVLAIFISCLGLVRAGVVCGRAADQRDWRSQSAGRECGQPMGPTFQRLCRSGFNCLPDCGTPGLVFSEWLAATVPISHRTKLVDFCRFGHGRTGHCAADGELPKHPGRADEPGEIVKKRVTHQKDNRLVSQMIRQTSRGSGRWSKFLCLVVPTFGVR